MHLERSVASARVVQHGRWRLVFSGALRQSDTNTGASVAVLFPSLPKGKALERSLTVLLPVHNAQATLGAAAIEILDVVSELTERFELIIVDDGSVDATGEIAHELSRSYPQVRAVHHGRQLGHDESLRSGLQQSSGHIVIVRDQARNPAAGEIARLWAALDRPERVLSRPEASRHRTWSRLSGQHPAHQSGYQVIDRSALQGPRRPSQPTRPNYLTRLRNFALGE